MDVVPSRSGGRTGAGEGRSFFSASRANREPMGGMCVVGLAVLDSAASWSRRRPDAIPILGARAPAALGGDGCQNDGAAVVVVVVVVVHAA